MIGSPMSGFTHSQKLRGQHPKAPNFKRESGLSSQHFLQGAGAVRFLVWEILQEMDFQQKSLVVSSSSLLYLVWS